MSELSDREDRFVEDQRRIEVRGVTGPDLEVLTAYLDQIVAKDALLAEAAEVLRESEMTLLRSTRCIAPERILDDLADWWYARAKPLLDKLGERE